MHETARLLFPAIRWNADTESFDDYRGVIDRGMELGVGGFIVFGGTAEAVRELTAELRDRAPHPLLIGADLERGAGQQFRGGTALPPPAALAQLDDLDVTMRAGELTAREAMAMGVNWVYAPVADLDLEPENPIVGSRSFGSDPEPVSRQLRAWIEGCRSGGALSCAKHFPGHGRTTSDSHLGLPVVDADADALETDLEPFRAAIDAGVDAMMSAHVAYPALDPERVPATLSRPILTGLLRERLEFQGLVVTDALMMEGVLEGGAGEPDAAVAAVNAGCDALLYPKDLEAVARGLESAGDRLDRQRVTESVARIRDAAEAVADRTAERATDPEPTRLWGRDGDREWALNVASRAIRPLRGEPTLEPGPVELITVDDDLGGPFPAPPRHDFAAALTNAGAEAREVKHPSGQLPVVVALYADIKGFKGRPGLSQTAVERVGALIDNPRGTVVVLFGHPRLGTETPGSRVLNAWGGESLMQTAAARWLLGER